MSEPEELLIQAAIHATSAAQKLWRRYSSEPERVALADVRRRIELLLTLLYGAAPAVVPADPPAPAGLFARLVRRLPRHLVDQRTLASTDGRVVRLPPSLEPSGVREHDARRYQLLALQQAARVARGSARYQPPHSDALARDLFVLAEAVAVEESLARELPGFEAALARARLDALECRPHPEALRPAEREVEALLREILRLPPSRPPAWAPVEGGPVASRAWALERARQISEAAAYRGLGAVELWGRLETSVEGCTPRVVPCDDADKPTTAPRIARMRRRPRVRQATDDEDDDRPGTFIVKADDAEQSVEDPMGLQRPADRDLDADADELADSLSELAEARLVRTQQRAREILLGQSLPERAAPAPGPAASAWGIVYPEWDYQRGCYRERGAVVRAIEPAAGDERWVRDALARHAGLVREVRRRFERLRPERLRLGRQRDGDDVDVDAFVMAYADRSAGLPDDGRLYQSVRPRRRDLALCLLVDASASTDSWVAAQLRVVDVEKEALLVVCEALETLGDPYAILAFSGEGPLAVTTAALKQFDERLSGAVRRRIAGLEPERYTRVGAALRHATALLAGRPARHQVLLLVSDGKPNDVDEYEGRYGVEDTHQAVVEARRQGMHVLCLTVDREAPAYVPRIFGPGGYTVLPRPELLPRVLVELLKRVVIR